MTGSGERKALPVTWRALALIALVGGCLFAGAAVVTGTMSPVIWIDVGVCMVLAVAFLVVHLISRTPRVRISPRGSWIDNSRNGIAVLVLVCAVLTPPLTVAAKFVGLLDGGSTVVINQEPCSARHVDAETDRIAPPLI